MAAVQVGEVEVFQEVVVVQVGSSFAPPLPSPLVPPLQWWWGAGEQAATDLRSPLQVAAPPLDLTLPWWPLGEEQAATLLQQAQAR
jgi:hypothetical protein